MHSTTALHTTGVAATCATLAPSKRPSGTRFFNTTRADYKKSLGRIFGAATPLGAQVVITPVSGTEHRARKMSQFDQK
jgi:hypothetical protein